jgi:hypothetical protein
MKEYNPGDLIVFKADSFLLDEEDPGSCPAGIIAGVELRTYGRYAAYVMVDMPLTLFTRMIGTVSFFTTLRN